uniref:Uncharacterized protein n=1 Tax=Cannabis sativa TaxID=3483 RepID=A0A803PGD0_CANSA
MGGRPNCCHISLAFVLKFLNFLQAFVGISIILYSLWMVDQWYNHIPINPPPPPLAPSPQVSEQIAPFKLAFDLFSGFDRSLLLNLHSLDLPAPWFIYSFMGVGILLCCITCIGCIAAEAINGCCLCFYTSLKLVFILLEAALVAFIAIDRRWEKDLPYDPTGELQSLRAFVEQNSDICKWIGIVVITVQALSLLLAIILRAMVSTRKADDDLEDDYDVRGRTREPLLNSQSRQASGSSKVDGRGSHSDTWSLRMRDKYGLNSSEKSNAPNTN